MGHFGSFSGKYLARWLNPFVEATSAGDGIWFQAWGIGFCITEGGSFISEFPVSGLTTRLCIISQGRGLEGPSMVITDCVETSIEDSGMVRKDLMEGDTNVTPDWSSIIASPTLDFPADGWVILTGHVLL